MSPHILIVEDHQGVRQSLREWLELSFPNYQLLEAVNGEEAVTTARTMSPCLVIMDIGLPGISGIEAAQGIKAALPATRVVLLTIYDDEAHRADAAAAGVSAYVPKRKVQTELLPVLTRLLRRMGRAPCPGVIRRALPGKNRAIQAEILRLPPDGRTRNVGLT
jgi:DNA-binding NarL/FixJ family response regulator